MKAVLFITPVRPDAHGFGRAKRAHQWVTILKNSYELSILVVNQGKENKVEKYSPNEFSISVKISKVQKLSGILKFLLMRYTKILSGIANLYWMPLLKTQKNLLNDHFSQLKFEKIICFRIYLSEYAFYLNDLTSARELELDIDDIESVTWNNISGLMWKNGKLKEAILNKLTSLQFSINEKRSFDRFRRIYVCSQQDEVYLSGSIDAEKIKVFSNKIWGKPVLIVKSREESFALLFVGILNYYPNEEAIRWFLKEAYPGLKQKFPEIEVNIVGSYASTELRAVFTEIPGLNFFENVPVIRDIYNKSNLVVSPLHAGGGTKFKMLEAMWNGLPVVATRESASGLGLVNGVHYFEANSAQEFIDQCATLIVDTRLRNAIISEACKLVESDFCY